MVDTDVDVHPDLMHDDMDTYHISSVLIWIIPYGKSHLISIHCHSDWPMKCRICTIEFSLSTGNSLGLINQINSSTYNYKTIENTLEM